MRLKLYVLLLSALPLPAAVRWPVSPGVFLRRTDSASIQFKVNAATAQILGPGALPAVQAAVNSWNAVPNTALRFETVVTTQSGIAQDTENVISFADSADAVASVGNAIAVTVPFGFSDGRITGSDIILNPKLKYTTTGEAGAYDLQSVVTHELGHALGANHAPTLNSTMFWVTTTASSGWSRLKPDDAAFAVEVYPGAGAASAYGKIAGKATKSGAPLAGAAVIAVDPAAGTTLGGISSGDGSYLLTVPAGNYQIYVTPVAPFTPTGAIYGYGQIDTGFLPAAGPAVQVAGGATATADISTVAGASGIQIAQIGTDAGSGATVRELPSGQSVNLYVYGSGLDSIAEQNINVLGPGIVFRAGSFKGNSSNGSGGFTVDLAARSNPTTASLWITNGSNGAFAPGALSILPPKPGFTAAGVVNAASSRGGGVSPGELVTLYGVAVGPESPAQSTGFDPVSGKLPTQLGGVRVNFNGVAAPLLYVSAGQINLQAPYELAGNSNTQITIDNLGSIGDSVSVPVLPAHPGLFAAVLNQDGSLNTQANPAPKGSYITLYATGGGMVTPSVMTGAPAPISPLSFAQSASVTIADLDAPVYQGAVLSPTFVGLLQTAAQVPQGAPSGQISAKLTIAGQASAPITVWAR